MHAQRFWEELIRRGIWDQFKPSQKQRLKNLTKAYVPVTKPVDEYGDRELVGKAFELADLVETVLQRYRGQTG